MPEYDVQCYKARYLTDQGFEAKVAVGHDPDYYDDDLPHDDENVYRSFGFDGRTCKLWPPRCVQACFGYGVLGCSATVVSARATTEDRLTAIVVCYEIGPPVSHCPTAQTP